jgi:hypothetical protein
LKAGRDTNGDDKREFKKWERNKWRKIANKPGEKKKRERERKVC